MLRCGPTPLVPGSNKSPDRQLVHFRLFPDVQAQQLVCDDLMDVDHGRHDTPCPEVRSLSPSRIFKTMWTPLGTAARYGVRQILRYTSTPSWYVGVADAGHPH